MHRDTTPMPRVLYSVPMKRINSFGLAAACLFSLALASCAPRQQAPAPRVEAGVTASSASFYPMQTGLIWTYIPEGEPAGKVPYVLRGLGPTIFKGESVSAVQLTGRGAEQTWFRQNRIDGVWLLGMTKPGATISLEPAWKELPASQDLRVGAAWEGASQVKLLDDAGEVKGEGTLQYRYDIQDKRRVKTPAGEYEVFVITRRVSDDLGGLFPAVQQMYYTPYVGEVKTYEGLLLTAKNYTERKQP